MAVVLGFFGRVARAIVALVVVLAVVVGGGFVTGVLGTPSVGGVTNAFGDVNETTTEIETDVEIRNPNPVGVSLGGLGVNYTVSMNDVRMATGTKQGLSIGTGNSTANLTTRMRNEHVPDWWASHVRNDETTTVRVDVVARSGTLGRSFAAPEITRSIETDVLSGFDSTETRAVNANQPGVEDPVLYVNRTSAAWGEVTDERTPIEIRFVVYNPKSVPVPITELGYNVTMNDVAVGSGASERTYVVPPRSTRTIDTTTAVRNERLDEWWVSHLRRNQVTDLRIDFHARIDTGVAGTVRVPMRGLTYEKTVETDVFGTKDGAGASGSDGTGDGTGDGDGDGGDGAAGDGTTDGGDATTTTDDGGLLGGGNESDGNSTDGLPRLTTSGLGSG